MTYTEKIHKYHYPQNMSVIKSKLMYIKTCKTGLTLTKVFLSRKYDVYVYEDSQMDLF